ncbi:hypothetical protein ACVIHB_009247 [Bradyrhizobium liaoningense]
MVKPIAPVDLMRDAAAFLGGFRAADLGGGGFEIDFVVEGSCVGDRVGSRRRCRKRRGGLAGKAREIVLHRLELRDLLLEGDTLVGIAHGDVEHRFQCAGDLKAACDAAHQHQGGLVAALRRGLDDDGLDLVERHGVAMVVADIQAGLDPRLGRIDQRDGNTVPAMRQHREVLRCLRERHAARTAGERAIGIEADAVLRRSRQHRHLAFGRGDPGLRQQPPRQHGLGQGHRDRETAGGVQQRKAIGKARAGAAEIIGHPGQWQARLAQRPPQRRLPRILPVVVDGLRIGEVGEDFLRGLDDDIVTLRHSVPRVLPLARPVS